jgi:hypothetical protein
MATSERGKALFEQRVEYPLPKKRGVRDYVFYFVNDDYGQAARAFFTKHYPNHVGKSVSSLEELIDALHSDVTSGGVSHIREVVIVSHGDGHGLKLPILRGTSTTNLAEFRTLWVYSLAWLQEDFAKDNPRVVSFKKRRAAVVAHLRDDSWVTVRACQFGYAAQAMYALFSFFGGRANVYAPREFQFFGPIPIMPGARLENGLQVHEHLVRQHFLPRDVHTPERKNAIVQYIVNPGWFSEPFALASRRQDDSSSSEALEYQRLVQSLNSRKIGDALKSKFGAHDHLLSSVAKVRVKARDRSWLVTDRSKHEREIRDIEYHIDEEFDSGEARVTLRAAATLAAVDSKQLRGLRRNEPVQLFFYQSQNIRFKGKLGEPLEAYLEEHGRLVDEEEFKTIFGQLPEATGPVEIPPAIRARFTAKAGVELSTAARIRMVAKQQKWAVEDGDLYSIRAEQVLTLEGIVGHQLWAYREWSNKVDRIRYQVEFTAKEGEAPDTPGPELAAYLDRLSVDDLMALIDHLRAPYRPEHSFYLHHVQEAIKRKKDYPQWSLARGAGDPIPTLNPYEALYAGEVDDKRFVAYDFNFNAIWQEVKASHPSLGSFRTDLFAEENLPKKLDIDISDRKRFVEIAADSPYTNLDDLRRLESEGRERYVAVQKVETYFPGLDEPGLSCAELEEILTTWKELQGLEPEEVKRRLELEKASDGKSFLEHILYFVVDKFLKVDAVTWTAELIEMPILKQGLFEMLAVHILRRPVHTELGAATTIGALCRFLPAFFIALELWHHSIEPDEKARELWEHIGKLTAIRQWLRELKLRALSDRFPDNLDIDLSVAGDDRPWTARYMMEQEAEGNVREFVFWNDGRIKKGFEEGVRIMERTTREILAQADDHIDAVLRELRISSCEAKVLNDVGLLDMRKIRGQVVHIIADMYLTKTPKVWTY